MKWIIIPLLFFLLSIFALSSASATTITIGDGDIFSEKDVNASIMINGVSDVAAATVDVTYDPSVTIITDAKVGDLKFLFNWNDEHASEGWVRIMGGQLEGGLNGNVKLAELTISPTGSYGEISNLHIDVIELRNNSGGTIDAEVMDGFFYIGKNGDVNADRTADSYDCVHIARWIVGVEGYELKEGAADVSGDGIVDAYDCVYLARHIAGISGYEGLE